MIAAGIGACVYGGIAAWEAYERGALPTWPEVIAATADLPARIAALSATELVGATPAAAQAPTRDSIPVVHVSASPDSVTVGPIGSPLPQAIDTLASDPALHPQAAATPPAAAAALSDTIGRQDVTPPPPATAVTPPLPALDPIVAQGRTELHDGIYALRSGDTVTVHFDTPEARTRRGEKFEQIVRATLPATHGAAAVELLAATPSGDLVGARDVVAELPARGIHLRTTDGRELSIWPETRPGRDGPLVVAYRAIRPR